MCIDRRDRWTHCGHERQMTIEFCPSMPRFGRHEFPLACRKYCILYRNRQDDYRCAACKRERDAAALAAKNAKAQHKFDALDRRERERRRSYVKRTYDILTGKERDEGWVSEDESEMSDGEDERARERMLGECATRADRVREQMAREQREREERAAEKLREKLGRQSEVREGEMRAEEPC